MVKQRLDFLLVDRGLVESRSLAQRLVMAGKILVNGEVIYKPATIISSSATLEIIQGPPFVSRGGEKLAAAIEAFSIRATDRICADVGASTGGFTDCLLQNGARRVYAIDVGKGILHWKLRQDQRVVVMEGANARYIERLPEPVSLVTIDASFISLKILLPVVRNWFIEGKEQTSPEKKNLIASPNESNQVLILIKPQFEAGKDEARRGKGVIRDPQIHLRVLGDVLNFAQEINYTVHDVIRSPISGPKGNIEFLAWLSYGPVDHFDHLLFDIDRDLPHLTR